jgi:pimeloyl-ACP methyl ester carboxylesterase
MTSVPAEPQNRTLQSQGLTLHYADWGNRSAPPLILVHGGRDHCRSWDEIARALQPRFHVIAPDLRGHGDSDWAKGSSYSLADYVYDLACLTRAVAPDKVRLAGHSMGGMISLMYAGTYPEKVDRLAVLDGVTVLPGGQQTAIHETIASWVSQLDRIAERSSRVYGSVAEAAERLSAVNRSWTAAQVQHLALHGLRQNADGSYRWKCDDYQQARAPYRLTAEQHIALWSRIACPTLLMRGDDSYVPDYEAAGALAHFKHAQSVRIAGAGHWLHHDKTDEVLGLLRDFFGA